jgi:hypothetical protein
LQRLRGVYYIVRSQAVVQPARHLPGIAAAHGFGNGRRERDDVVFHFGFDFLNTFQFETGVRAQRLSRFEGYFAQFR